MGPSNDKIWGFWLPICFTNSSRVEPETEKVTILCGQKRKQTMRLWRRSEDLFIRRHPQWSLNNMSIQHGERSIERIIQHGSQQSVVLCVIATRHKIHFRTGLALKDHLLMKTMTSTKPCWAKEKRTRFRIKKHSARPFRTWFALDLHTGVDQYQLSPKMGRWRSP